MIRVAGRSIFLSFLVLVITFFYIQPEVGEAFNLANDSQNNINNEKLTETITNQPETVETTKDNPSDNPTVDSKENTTDKNLKVTAYSATAYCLKGRTASGGSVRRGIVAADPRVLPLGTKIYMDAGPYSGTYVVADTGGAVRGRRLDVWVPSQKEAIKFGRRKVTIRVLGR